MLFNFLASNRMIQSLDPVLCGEYVNLTGEPQLGKLMPVNPQNEND
jgi:hypothetical protein